MTKITVSQNTFEEVASKLKAAGVEINTNATALTLAKGDYLEPPTNFKLVTIRRDVADIASKTYDYSNEKSFVEYVNELYNYVMNEELPKKTEGWK